MARIDLNIVDRGTSSTFWTADEGVLTADKLDKVLEQKTDNCNALNSLPTPFARFFVAQEAFRRCLEEHNDEKKEAGFAYRQLVSDILDIYELLFNLNYHRNIWNGRANIELREWNCADNLERIKGTMPVLYNSLADYYKTDIKENKLYFLVFTENGKDKLLACSSPITGFVTPPDLDKTSDKNSTKDAYTFYGQQYHDIEIRRKSGGEYFREALSFGEREVDFKNYMYNELFGSADVDARFKTIKEYIRSFANDPDIRNNHSLKLSDVKTDQNDNLIINGLQIKTSAEEDIDSYFNNVIIKVPYRISRKTFTTVKYQNEPSDRNYDYLLPFKPEILNLFSDGKIQSEIHVSRNSSVDVHLHYNGKDYNRTYSSDNETYKIIDLAIAKINFDLGIFPNILSPKDNENNYFKVLVVATDEDKEAPNFNIDKISLSFYKKGDSGKLMLIREVVPTDNARFGVQPAVVRSRQKTNEEESGTKFYELFNTSFDYIEINILGNKGLLLPVWQKSHSTNSTYTYAIDLGTSNTFLSCCKNDTNGKPDLSKKPELFKMQRTMVNFMHEIHTDNQTTLVRRIEDSVFPNAKKKLKTEFLPALIDGVDYRFPIRTALCGIRTGQNKPKLFDSHNIAFFYEKLMANEDQNVRTDLKWEKDETLLRIFVRELLLIIKCDILQKDGDLNRTKIIWFSPLSFSGRERALYQDIWNSEPKNILSVQSSQVTQYSESEAPYYYYKKMDYIKNSDAVSVIDIGGGSTDFVYFKDNMPQVASSIHFGCDVLWENGFIEYGNEKKNGIFKKYATTLRFEDRRDLDELNEKFQKVDSMTTKDIINFWIGNADHCDIMAKLRTDFSPVFVYHFVSIMYFMAWMYKDNNLQAPYSIVFSGNGSKYIDNFISSDPSVLKQIINMIFNDVFGGEHDINLKLPNERKESTCYGGLYRDVEVDNVKGIVYQGDNTFTINTVKDMNLNLEKLKSSLMEKYNQLAELYCSVLDLLKRERIIDSDMSKYAGKARESMQTDFSNRYKTEVKEKYGDGDIYNDSVFFLPIIKRVFEMTKL